MQSSTRKRHAHKRSSSLCADLVFSRHQEQTVLVSEINSEETLKLLEESQTKSQFQSIVDLFHPNHELHHPIPTDKTFEFENGKEKHFGEILNEYFQIQSLSLMKNTFQKQEKPNSNCLDLEKLENQAKTNSRLRYHGNKRSKALNSTHLQLDFYAIHHQTAWNENYYKINPCAKA